MRICVGPASSSAHSESLSLAGCTVRCLYGYTPITIHTIFSTPQIALFVPIIRGLNTRSIFSLVCSPPPPLSCVSLARPIAFVWPRWLQCWLFTLAGRHFEIVQVVGKRAKGGVQQENGQIENMVHVSYSSIMFDICTDNFRMDVSRLGQKKNVAHRTRNTYIHEEEADIHEKLALLGMDGRVGFKQGYAYDADNNAAAHNDKCTRSIEYDSFNDIWVIFQRSYNAQVRSQPFNNIHTFVYV